MNNFIFNYEEWKYILVIYMEIIYLYEKTNFKANLIINQFLNITKLFKYLISFYFYHEHSTFIHLQTGFIVTNFMYRGQNSQRPDQR